MINCLHTSKIFFHASSEKRKTQSINYFKASDGLHFVWSFFHFRKSILQRKYYDNWNSFEVHMNMPKSKNIFTVQNTYFIDIICNRYIDQIYSRKSKQKFKLLMQCVETWMACLFIVSIFCLYYLHSVVCNIVGHSTFRICNSISYENPCWLRNKRAIIEKVFINDVNNRYI